jgi:hypothetical protein
MQTWVIRKQGFNGNVTISSQPDHSYYSYSLWRARTGEHLFDGAAGDLAEAMESLHAHISFLSARQNIGSAATE